MIAIKIISTCDLMESLKNLQDHVILVELKINFRFPENLKN